MFRQIFLWRAASWFIFTCLVFTARFAVAAPSGPVQSFSLPTTLVRPYKSGDAGRQILVYTPVGYDDPANVSRRYPVFYLLHGSPGNPSNFVKYGAWPDLLQKAGVGPAILVAPDGNYADDKHGDSEWANSADGQDKFEDFVVKEVVNWTDGHFRTDATAGRRFLAGVSEGGYGAVNLTLRHPDIFGGALSCSGYFDNDGSGWARRIMGSNAAFLRENSPLLYVNDAVKDKRIPSGWKTLKIFVGAGADEKRYLTETKAVAAKLKAAGVPVALSILDGKHGWDLWDQLFTSGLKILLPAQTEKSGGSD